MTRDPAWIWGPTEPVLTTCGECKGDADPDGMVQIWNGPEVCEHCADENYTWCADCLHYYEPLTAFCPTCGADK